MKFVRFKFQLCTEKLNNTTYTFRAEQKKKEKKYRGTRIEKNTKEKQAASGLLVLTRMFGDYFIRTNGIEKNITKAKAFPHSPLPPVIAIYGKNCIEILMRNKKRLRRHYHDN